MAGGEGENMQYTHKIYIAYTRTLTARGSERDDGTTFNEYTVVRWALGVSLSVCSVAGFVPREYVKVDSFFRREASAHLATVRLKHHNLV